MASLAQSSHLVWKRWKRNLGLALRLHQWVVKYLVTAATSSKASPARSTHSECSNHSLCFFHTVSTIKRYCKECQWTYTNQFDSLDGCDNLSCRLTPKFQQNLKKIFFTKILTWLHRDLGHWIVPFSCMPWGTSPVAPCSGKCCLNF